MPNGLQCPSRLAKLGIESSAKNDSNSTALELQKTMQEFMKQIDARMSAMENATRRSRSPSSSGDTETQQRRRSVSEGGHPRGPADHIPQPPPLPTTSNAKLSGRDKTALDVVTLDIPWPHYFVTSANQRPVVMMNFQLRNLSMDICVFTIMRKTLLFNQQ